MPSETSRNVEGIVWEDPPADGRSTRYYQWHERLKPLQERPNEWARIIESSTLQVARSRAAQLRGRKTKRPDGYEFASGTFGDGGAVWARYVGGDA